MATGGSRRKVQPGDPAPDFTLPAADREGVVSLSEYRGRSPVLLALFRGLYCPFCRRQMIELGTSAEQLKAAGVATLGVVASAPDRARLYFRYRPSRIPLGADPELTTHRAYDLPQFPLTPQIIEAVDSAALEWARQLGLPAQPGEAHKALDRVDGFEPVESDAAEYERHQALIIGQFLIDPAGIVRWTNIERKVGDFPSAEELLAVARAL